jgi:hypothetical protein
MAAKYTPAQITEKFLIVNQRIAQGEPLRDVLKDLRISSNTWSSWVSLSAEHELQYTHATDERADKIFEDMIKIADDASQDLLATDRGEIGNMVKVQRDRLRIETRKWALGKLKPKKFSDKLTLQGDADNPIQSKLTIEVLPASGRIASSESDIDD